MTQRVVNYTYGTGNPVLPDGSIDVRDGIDNLQSMDVFMNAPEDTYNQRDGEIVKTRSGAVRAVGIQRVGDFTAGCTVTERNQGVLYETDGTVYVWIGALPKVVPPASSPATTGGIGPAGWLDIGDASAFDRILLLLSEPEGSSLIGFEQVGAGSIPRTSQDKMRERVTPLDFYAHADGVTLDDTAFAKLETTHLGMEIDLLGKQYAVTVQPIGNKYYNGEFIVAATPRKAPYAGVLRCGNGLIIEGEQAAASLPINYDVGINRFTYTNGAIALGTSAMKNMQGVLQSIAIGPSAMENGTRSFDNTAIGEVALQNVSSVSEFYSSSYLTGTRNVAIGGNAGQFLTTGHQNVFVGRNTATSAVSIVGAVAVGAGAMMGGGATGGWTPTIENWWPNTTSAVHTLTAVGSYAAFRYTGNDITAIGGGAGTNLTRATNCTMVGLSAGLNLEANLLPNGNTQVIPPGGSYTATYSKTGSVVTVTYPGHSAVAGKIVGFEIPDGPAKTDGSHTVYYPVASVIDANTFTVSCPLAGDGTGSFVVATFDTGVAGTPCALNTFVGSNAGHDAKTGTSANTFIGFNAGYSADNTTTSTVVGSSAGNAAKKMTNTSLFGWNAANSGGVGAATLTNCTFLGALAGNTNLDGSTPAIYNNVSILGYSARVSGDNQVQLGNSGTTTYVYGTVQNRSDERDKADLVPTTIGDDFIDGLVAEEGHWDMRDDYFEEYEVQVGIDKETAEPIFETRLRAIPKDGSKKRNRKHQWFVAQKVKALCDELGVDFGGFQDHSVSGGCDVLSLGYDEFIPPLTAYVQRRKVELRELESVVAQQQAAIKSLTERLTTLEGEQ